MDATQKQIETVEKDYGKDSAAIVKRWVAEIELYEEEYKDYHQRCSDLLERYRDERKTEGTKKLPRLNLLWSNNNVIEPSTYSQRPKLEASRRFHDRDPIGRLSCEIIERAVSLSLDDDRYDFDGVIMRARQDFVLLGRGVLWERYEPVIVSGQVTDDKTGQASESEEQQPQAERVAYEHTCTEHLHYEDFGHTSGARAWEEVSMVYRRAYMSRDELVKRFNKKNRAGTKLLGADVPLDYTPKRISAKKDTGEKYSHFKKGTIYEIHDRSSGKVYWISREYPNEPLDVMDAPMELRGFFPCPKPAYGTLTNDSLIPIPDYAQIQDLCSELDLLTARIKLITDAIKVKGGYEKSLGDLTKLLSADDNKLVPIDLTKFLSVAGTPDLHKLILFMPIEQLVAVLQVLYDARERTKALIYEISGNSDLMRGATDPRETATAQQGKMTFVSKRLKSKQDEFARFARDLFRIKAEIICEKFRPETIAQMVGFDPQKSEQDLSIPQIPMPMPPQPPPMPGQPPMPPPEPQMMPPEMVFGQALQLMRDDTMRAYRIDIETDSTVALDEQQEKADATELVVNIGQYFQNAMPIVQVMPSFGPVAKELLMFIIRRYKAGRGMEESIERALDESIQAAAAAQEAQGQQPDPAMAKVQQDGQMQQQKMQQDAQEKAAASQMQTMAEQGKMLLEQEKLKATREQMVQDAAFKAEELALKRAIAIDELELKRQTNASQAHIAEQKALADIITKGVDPAKLVIT